MPKEIELQDENNVADLTPMSTGDMRHYVTQVLKDMLTITGDTTKAVGDRLNAGALVGKINETIMLNETVDSGIIRATSSQDRLSNKLDKLRDKKDDDWKGSEE